MKYNIYTVDGKFRIKVIFCGIPLWWLKSSEWISGCFSTFIMEFGNLTDALDTVKLCKKKDKELRGEWMTKIKWIFAKKIRIVNK